MHWLLVKLLEANKMTLQDINVKYLKPAEGRPAFDNERVVFARALAREPEVLLLDEPFGALDALTRLRMQELFGRLRGRHRFAALLVAHDVEEALLLADRALVLDRGVIAADLPVTLEHPRAPDDPGFGTLRRQLLELLGVPLAS